MAAPQDFPVFYGVPTTRTNLVTNPSFETNTTGWTASSATVARITTDAWSGSACAQVTSTATSYNNIITGFIAVTAGQQYTLSAYAKNVSGNTRTVYVAIQWFTSAGVYISETNSASQGTLAAGSAWTIRNCTGTAPATATQAKVVLLTGTTGLSAGWLTNWDGVLFEQSSTVSWYFDGSTYVTDLNDQAPQSVVTAWTGTANASTSTATYDKWTTLSNVQEISARIGRQLLQDVYSPSSATILARYPTGFASPITALKVNTWVKIDDPSGNDLWLGRIRDFYVEYGIPYTAGVGPSDYINIQAEGLLASYGRQQGNNYAMGAATTTSQISTSGTQVGVAAFINTQGFSLGNPTVDAATVSGSWLEWLNRLLASNNTRVLDGGGSLTFYNKNYIQANTINFSDTTNNATNQVYDRIEFSSKAANYYTQVQVQTLSYGNSVASTGSAPYRTYQIETYNSSAAQALDLANYWLDSYENADITLQSISCFSASQNNWNLALGSWWDCIGKTANVTFRGTTKAMTILGAAMTATPDESRFTFYLAGADLTPYLILDDPNLGKLNVNKLGY